MEIVWLLLFLISYLLPTNLISAMNTMDSKKLLTRLVFKAFLLDDGDIVQCYGKCHKERNTIKYENCNGVKINIECRRNYQIVFHQAYIGKLSPDRKACFNKQYLKCPTNITLELQEQCANWHQCTIDAKKLNKGCGKGKYLALDIYYSCMNNKTGEFLTTRTPPLNTTKPLPSSTVVSPDTAKSSSSNQVDEDDDPFWLHFTYSALADIEILKSKKRIFIILMLISVLAGIIVFLKIFVMYTDKEKERLRQLNTQLSTCTATTSATNQNGDLKMTRLKKISTYRQYLTNTFLKKLSLRNRIGLKACRSIELIPLTVPLSRRSFKSKRDSKLKNIERRDKTTSLPLIPPPKYFDTASCSSSEIISPPYGFESINGGNRQYCQHSNSNVTSSHCCVSCRNEDTILNKDLESCECTSSEVEYYTNNNLLRNSGCSDCSSSLLSFTKPCRYNTIYQSRCLSSNDDSSSETSFERQRRARITPLREHRSTRGFQGQIGYQRVLYKIRKFKKSMSHESKKMRRTQSDNEISREKYKLENELSNKVSKSEGNLLEIKNLLMNDNEQSPNNISQIDFSAMHGKHRDEFLDEWNHSELLSNCDSTERCSCISMDRMLMTSLSTMYNRSSLSRNASSHWSQPGSKKHSLASNYSHINGGHTLHLIDLQTNRRVCCQNSDSNESDDDVQFERLPGEKMIKCTPAGSENSWPSIPWQDLERETVL